METNLPDPDKITRLTLLEWLSFLARLIWLLALVVASALSDILDIKLAFIFFAWGSYAVLLLFLRPSIHGSRTVDWLVSMVDTILALVMITLSGGLASPLWSSLLVGTTIIALMRGGTAGILLTSAGLLAAGGINLALSSGGFWPMLAWSLYLGPVLLSAVLLGKLIEQILVFLHQPVVPVLAAAGPVQHQEQNINPLFHLAAELNASLNYDRVIETTLELSASALAGDFPVDDHLIGAVILFEHDALVIKADRGLTRADRRITFPAKKGLLAEAINSGDPCLREKPVNDPELQRLVALHACQHALAVPLTIGMETYGVLLIAHPMAGYFSPDRVELMEAVGQQVIVALQNARLYHDLEIEKERIMKIEEEARKKLARDLHDGPTQSIAAIAMRVNFARRLLDKDRDNAIAELEKVEDLARKTTREIRHMLFTLRPLILESQGLVAALLQLAEKLSDGGKHRIFIDIPRDLPEQLDMKKQGVLFYIAEEAVHNAVKHAEAENIHVRMRSDDEFATLEVEDDGVGFNIGAVDREYHQRGSLGLVNMRERTVLLNCLLNIESQQGFGTRITISFPLSEQAAEDLHTPGPSVAGQTQG